jgi:hypothetical protein
MKAVPALPSRVENAKFKMKLVPLRKRLMPWDGAEEPVDSLKRRNFEVSRGTRFHADRGDSGGRIFSADDQGLDGDGDRGIHAIRHACVQDASD